MSTVVLGTIAKDQNIQCRFTDKQDIPYQITDKKLNNL